MTMHPFTTEPNEAISINPPKHDTHLSPKTRQPARHLRGKIEPLLPKRDVILHSRRLHRVPHVLRHRLLERVRSVARVHKRDEGVAQEVVAEGDAGLHGIK